MISTLELGMAIVLFLAGLSAVAAGLWTILSREYQASMRALSAQSAKIGTRATLEDGIAPIVDSAARLVEAVSQLIRTAVGIGVFLCTGGVLICLAAFWMISKI
jgi:hypothetical protein